MKNLTRITFNPNVMGGKPCIRGLRVTVGTIVGLVAAGHSNDDILKAYPYKSLLETGSIITVDEGKCRVRILPF